MIERLRELYSRSNAVRTPEEDISLHLEHGYLIKTPDYILMGKRVVRWMSDEELKNPMVAAPKGIQSDAWYIYLFCGSACNFLSFEPFPLEYVGWHRRGILRWYHTKTIQAKCRHMIPFLTESFLIA